MRSVMIALIPGAMAQIWFFGPGYLVNLAVAGITAVAVEALVMRLRSQPVVATLADGSALVTAALLALAMPPAVPPATVVVATATGLLRGKHIYGGRGGPLFTPAMGGYATVLVSFPRQLAAWPPPRGATDIEALTGATPLEVFMHRGGQTVEEVWRAADGFGQIGALGWEWINVAFLAGGLWLVARRIVDWRIPLGFLASIGVLAALGYDGGSSDSLGSPLFHWFSGGTLLAAFFIATDPVTAPSSPRARLLFGAMVGTLVYVIRTLGNYPDGIAFAILLGNATAPMLDHYLLRRGAHA